MNSKPLVLATGLLAAVPLAAQDAQTVHYWDMDTLDPDTSTTPLDVVGGVPMAAGANLLLEETPYGSSPAGGAYLRTERTVTGVPLSADVFNGGPTAMDFGTGSFSFSYWTYNDASDDDVGGPEEDVRRARVFDNLSNVATGIQLGSNLQGIFNFRIDDSNGVFIRSNIDPVPPLDALEQPDDKWVLVVVNVDRDPAVNLAEILFDGVSQGTYDLSTLTGDVAPTQDLQIGCINGGTNPGGIQTAGLDDLAFYTGILSAQQITDLQAGVAPNVVAPPAPPAPASPVGHYWDFDTPAEGVPGDLYGELTTSEVGLPVIDSRYGEAYAGAGRSLNSELGFFDHLVVDTFAAEPTALDFGADNFALSFWSFNDTEDLDDFGAHVFDFLAGETTGVQLGTTAAGVFNLRMDDDAGNTVVSNNELGFEDLTMPADRWVHVVLNVDRTNNTLQIYFDGAPVAPGAIDLSPLTGNIFCTQDLQLGVRNGGDGAGGAQNSGLDDFAIYPDVLSQEQISDLASASTSPLDVLASFEPAGDIPVVDVAWSAATSEFTVTFQSTSGAPYSVFGGEDLTAVSEWPEISTADLVGDDSELSFTYAAPGTPNAFWFEVRED